MQKLTDQVKLLQKIVLVHRGEFLILQRSPKSHYRPNQWDLPGGNSHWPTQTEGDLAQPHLSDVLRELEEETDIAIRDEKLDLVGQIAQSSPIYFGTYFEAQKQLFTMIVGWQLNLPDEFDRSRVKLSHEHTQQVWIKPSQFDEYDFGFAGKKDGFIWEMVEKMSI
ncbi:MAG: NUDIX domain-containing protein [Patescibacteria group bacterium]|nr:NUDIX domain-containing protein [Patescibacteria group bacterium]